MIGMQNVSNASGLRRQSIWVPRLMQGSFLICLLVLVSGQASAASVSDRLSEWRKGIDHSCKDIGNMAAIEQIAKDGNVDAQVFMTWSYWQGNQCGVSRDEFQSKEWAQRAADQEDAEAQLAVAYYFENGYKMEPIEGITSDDNFDVGGGLDRIGKDEELAWNWIVSSANQGYAPAFAIAARFYFQGKYVPSNASEAYNLYMEAGKRGYTDGYFGAAGVMFGSVRTSYIMKDAKNFDEGSVIAMWLYYIADKTDTTFFHRLPHASAYNRIYVENSIAALREWMSPEQLARARQDADETLKP
jgi:uncharacterized protein